MSTEEELMEETEKWEEKLEQRLGELEGESEFRENAEAYLEDSRHFREEGDLVRAFEAVIWGWAWLEIGEDLEPVNGGKREEA